MKLLVTWPLAAKGDGWPSQCVPYHLALHEWCVKHDVPAMTLRGYLDENRNQALLLAQQMDCTHVAMLDGDHQHPPETLERLWQHAQDDPTRMVVAGVAPQAEGIHRPMFGIISGPPDKPRRTPITQWGVGQLVSCDWTAVCAAIISVKVMQLWPKPWFWFSYDKAGRWTTEDINFCDGLWRHEEPVYVDTGLVLPHRSEHYVGLEDWRRESGRGGEE